MKPYLTNAQKTLFVSAFLFWCLIIDKEVCVFMLNNFDSATFPYTVEQNAISDIVVNQDWHIYSPSILIVMRFLNSSIAHIT